MTDPSGRAPTPSTPPHIPVLLAEVLAALAPADGELIIDGTFGAGGYSRAILEAANCRVLAFDRDITAVRTAAPLFAQFPGRLTVVNHPFAEMEDIGRAHAEPQGGAPPKGPFADAVVLDIGVSSMQLDQPARGFSFQHDGPLDMRMSAPVDPLTGQPAPAGPSAADFLASADEEKIADVIYLYGEERRSRAIARAIVADRDATPFTSTLQLARLVSRVLGGRGADGRHPATRTFQALRIHVNDELGQLSAGLAAAERILKPGGRLAVVTFHSLEDRIVKQFFAQRSGKVSHGSRHLPPTAEENSAARFQFVNQRPLTSGQPELDANPRARSARLRVGIRTGAAPSQG